MLEEPSARSFIEEWMPRQYPGIAFLCVPHQGKSDLEKSLRKKLRAWKTPEDRFLVLRDNDGANCRQIIERLLNICSDAGKPEAIVRLACQELEAWYLGDLAAVERAYGKSGIACLQSRKKFRDPDGLGNPSEEMLKLVPEYGKLDGAKRLGQELGRDSSISYSFRKFVAGIEKILD